MNGKIDLKSRPLGFTDPLYLEAYGFLVTEAAFLDNNQFQEWKSMLSEDLLYTMPVRTTHENVFQTQFSKDMFHFYENYRSIGLRIRRMETEYAWAEDPASRARRFVTNVRVSELEDNRLDVKSYQLVTRSRLDATDSQLLSMERCDLLEQTDSGLKLVKREIYADSTIIGMKNLQIFL
ncbi:3-phenylpropionate/cinnamic acid dioxygenase subunit beta [Bacillus sp. ISL-18]|uniref:aromatic-ring-hydroxylating dioxygenase subunit beta n=1 Tax=Bacillus sp. ISL-18 TaxID=2819118 RepID=UPI001BEA2C0B|nr:3-phenylpropionate/cinnamic acid dioxygenase subunit beta [Bacillus sp. ISL-18]MBT2654978.1 3-phenylpropionate/cinnamic acid dioxygenase subunit beta [Bacillus sp. ISL-18]